MLDVRLQQVQGRFTRACAYCRAVLDQGDPGAPVSHGIGTCCWDLARASAGLPPAPYPSLAGHHSLPVAA